MEEKNKKGDCGDCGNGGCGCGGMRAGMSGCGGMHRHFLLRIVIMFALLGFVFWSGVKIGELKSYFDGDGMMGGRGAYGRWYMMGGNGDGAGWDMSGYGPGMMRGRQATTTPR